MSTSRSQFLNKHYTVRRGVFALVLIVATLPTGLYALTNLQSGAIGVGIGAGATALLGQGGAGAATAAGLAGETAANAMCAVYIPTHCGCKQMDGPHGSCVANPANTFSCPLGTCIQYTNKIPVAGICDAVLHCKAVSVGGIGGGAATGVDSGLAQLGQMLGSVLKDLMGKGGGGGDSGGGGSGSGGDSAGNSSTCTSYYQVTTPSSDPCAYYVPSNTATSGVNTSGQDLLNALNGGQTGTNLINQLNGNLSSTSVTNTNTNNNTNPNINTNSDTNTNTNTNTDTNTGTNLNTDLTSTANVTGTFKPAGPYQSPTTPGLSGSIQTTGTGATFVSSDIKNNTQTSSFFGADTLGGAVRNLVSGWCRSRPWAGGFIASIVAPSFFDGLCTHNGFAVGAPVLPTVAPSNNIPSYTPRTNIVLTQTPIQKQKPKILQVIASSTPLLPPRVDIWAVPPTVPLGARTTIFWNTENVTNCTETSPDGSFSQTSLSGGAATVPLTEATTYTISCLDSQHNPATSYMRVKIAN